MRCSIALAGVLAMIPVLAHADEVTFPQRRPGLWERTVRTGDSIVRSTACADQASDAALLQRGRDTVKRMGGSLTVTGGGSQFHVESTVVVSGHTITTSEEMTFQGDTGLHGRAHTHIDPPLPQAGMPADTERTSDATWVGPCPADMRPGDTLPKPNP